jgi:hypothetical protein
MPTGALGEVVVEVEGRPRQDAAAQQRAGMAAQ